MKLDFIQDENGAWVLEIKANSDFNLHLERASNYSQDVYLYVRGSSEGEYKLFKKLFGRVIDLDVDIPDAIVPKYYRIKCDSQPTLCEVTGNVDNVTGVVVPGGGASADLGNMMHIYHAEEYVDGDYDFIVVDVNVNLDTEQHKDNSYAVTAYEDNENDTIEYRRESIQYLVSRDPDFSNGLRLVFDANTLLRDTNYCLSILVSEDGWKLHGVPTINSQVVEDAVIEISPLKLEVYNIPVMHSDVYISNDNLGKTVVLNHSIIA